MPDLSITDDELSDLVSDYADHLGYGPGAEPSGALRDMLHAYEEDLGRAMRAWIGENIDDGDGLFDDLLSDGHASSEVARVLLFDDTHLYDEGVWAEWLDDDEIEAFEDYLVGRLSKWKRRLTGACEEAVKATASEAEPGGDDDEEGEPDDAEPDDEDE